MSDLHAKLMALADEYAKALERAVADTPWWKDAAEKRAALSTALREVVAQAQRYETVRRMSVPMFQDAYVLNARTGKPFDEIIDDLQPFMFPDSARSTK